MKVIVSDPISDDGLKIFYDNNIDVVDATNSTIDENYEHIPTANAWVIRSGTTLNASIISKADKLAVIGRAGVGIDNIDVSAATRKGVVVMNTPDANTISAAEHTMALLLSLSRNILFYQKIKLSDVFETRIYLMFVHFSLMMIIFKKKFGLVATRCGSQMKFIIWHKQLA